MTADIRDNMMRRAAFKRVQVLQQDLVYLTANDLKPGFRFEGERIPLVNPQRGIFKPRQMRFLLSVKTVYPRPGGKVWYDDQLFVHRQIFESEDLVEYAFMGTNPASADNRWLREAYELRIPIIYFLGVAPGLYEAIFPVFVSEWNSEALKASLVFGLPILEEIVLPNSAPDNMLGDFPETALERRYALQTVKQRLHQSSFREAVIHAYGGRCAVSGIPEPLLLDAAHIVPDKHEQLGQPIIPNGLPLSKIHHAAFDTHLLGIDPDFRLHIADRLLEKEDGPLLDSLKRLGGKMIHLPSRHVDLPDRDRLALRFESFKAAA